jgi:serine/threonine protein kinase
MIDLIERCLQWDPAVRITASEALQHPWVSSLGQNVRASIRKHLA